MVRAKHQGVFELAGVEVPAGSRMTIDLEVAQLYTHSPLSIPVEVLHGKRPGPVLLVSAAIHGDELNGVEAVRQILSRLDVSKIKGTLVAVPVVNVFGFIHKSRYLPDRRDLNRSFPGSEKGSIAGRIAYQFFQQVASKCSHVIDLHTGAIYRTNFPQIRADLSDEASAAMAEAFGAPIIIDSEIREGSLRAVAQASGIPVITYEGGEALRFEPVPIAAAVHGITRVMRHLGMLRKSRKRTVTTPVIARASSWVRAEQNGIVRSKVALGDRVQRGQVLAYISAPLGQGEYALLAHRGGIVIGQQTLPLVNEGDAVFHIASFQRQNDLVEQQVGNFIGEVLDQVEVEEELRIGMPEQVAPSETP